MVQQVLLQMNTKYSDIENIRIIQIDVEFYLQDYVIGKSDHPLILHGASGCGKTSLMAKAASQVRPY